MIERIRTIPKMVFVARDHSLIAITDGLIGVPFTALIPPNATYDFPLIVRRGGLLDDAAPRSRFLIIVSWRSTPLDMAAAMAGFHLVVDAGPTRTGTMIYEVQLQFGEPPQVLCDSCERELELGPARPAQSQAAAPPSSVMKSRRFTAQYLPCFRPKGYGGSPEATRRAFDKRFLLDLAEDWQQHGREVLKRVRRESPAAYLKVCAMLVPREMKLEHSGGVKAMTDEQLERSIELLKEMIAKRKDQKSKGEGGAAQHDVGPVALTCSAAPLGAQSAWRAPALAGQSGPHFCFHLRHQSMQPPAQSAH
jgi:hypothetical protein